MSLFHRKPSYVGIDFGSGGIKLVELIKEHGKPRLLTYGLVDLDRNITRDQSPAARTQTVGLLKELLQRTNCQARRVVASIPDFSVFSAIVRLPVMPEKDMRQAVVWEAKKIIPLPVEDVNIDWQMLEAEPPPMGATVGEAELKRVLLTAAPKNIVSQYVGMLQAADLTVASLETESFALIRSLVGRDPSTVLVVDIGAMVTHMVIVEKDVPVLTRSIDVGGKTISQAIANVLGVEVKRAEQFKRVHGIPLQATDSSGAPKAIATAVQTMVQETRYVLDTYTRQEDGKIAKIILTGGTALLPGLAEYIGKQLNQRVFIGDPFARVVYPLELQPLLQELGPRLAVSVGLAMWGMGE